MFPFRLCTEVISPMKFKVKSNFFKDSHPSKFSILSMLFNAKFRYSSSFSFETFSVKRKSEESTIKALRHGFPWVCTFTYRVTFRLCVLCKWQHFRSNSKLLAKGFAYIQNPLKRVDETDGNCVFSIYTCIL